MNRDRNQKEVILNELINPKPHQQIEKKQKEKQILDLLNRKNQEIIILNQVSKNVVILLDSRLGGQLALLQKKLGIDHQGILRELQNMGEISVAFHYETGQLEHLDVLLNAYDQNTLRQKKLIALLYSELEDAEKKSQNLVRENGFLLNQMQEKCKQILQIYNKGFPEDNLVTAYNKLQLESENQRIAAVKQENQYLLANYNELETRFKKTVQELDESRKYAEKYFQMYKNQTEQLQQAQIRVDDLMKIKDVLEKKFDQVSQENIELQTLKNQLQNKYNRVENDYKTVKNQVLNLKKVGRDETQKLKIQIDTTKMEAQTSRKKEREILQKSMTLEREFEVMRDGYRKSKLDLEKKSSDYQNMLRMLEAYENKLAHFSKKEEDLRQRTEEYKAKLDDVILQKDKAIMKEDSIQKRIQYLIQQHRDEINSQKHSFEKILQAQRRKLEEVDNSREETQSNYQNIQFSLKNQLEKMRRQNSMLREENNKFVTTLKTGSENQIINKIRELEQRNEALNKLVSQKDRTLRDQTEHKEEIIRNLQNQNRDLSRQVDKERAAARQAINERTQYRSKISIVQKQKECLQDELHRFKKTLDSKSRTYDEDYERRVKQLELKLAEAVKKQKSTKQRAVILLQEYDVAEQKLKAEYENRIRQLESQNQKLKRKANKGGR